MKIVLLIALVLVGACVAAEVPNKTDCDENEYVNTVKL